MLEIPQAIFSLILELVARKATLRDKSRPRWFNYSLATTYYVLPTVIVVSVFISWKTTVVAACFFIATLIAGAASESDDLGAP